MLLPCVRSTLGSVRCLFIILSNGFIAFFPLHFPVFSGTLSSEPACLPNCRGGGGDDGWWGRLRRPLSVCSYLVVERTACAPCVSPKGLHPCPVTNVPTVSTRPASAPQAISSISDIPSRAVLPVPIVTFLAVYAK